MNVNVADGSGVSVGFEMGAGFPHPANVKQIKVKTINIACLDENLERIIISSLKTH